MISILFIVLFGVLGYFFNKGIHKHFNIILGITIVLSAITFFIDFEIVTQGFLGLSLFVIVMFAGAFRKDSKISKRFRSIRKEYSILGFVILLPHAIKYLIQFIDGSYPVEWFGLIAYIVMLPLFIISFTYIKNKMNIKTWFKIQKWAYLAYAAIFLHLILIGSPDHIAVYVVIFSLYTIFKLANYVFVKDSRTIEYIKAIFITALGMFITLTITGTINVSNVFAGEEAVTIDLSTIEDGTYYGEGTGFNGLEVSLDVVVEDGEIIDIIVYEYGSTTSHNGMNFQAAGVEMVNDIISSQDTGIDSISGATKTTEGIQEAVIDALS